MIKRIVTSFVCFFVGHNKKDRTCLRCGRKFGIPNYYPSFLPNPFLQEEGEEPDT